MSNEPTKWSWLSAGAALLLVLIGGVVGYLGGIYFFCRPGSPHTGCALMTLGFAVPSGMAIGFGVYAVIRAISKRR